jgi:cytochrome b pre-mRNA-processing protein 3
MIFRFFNKNSNAAMLASLHERLVTASRKPVLYTDLRVPDTLEGRFEALALHYILLIRHLQRKPAPGPDIAQDMSDQFFKQIESSLREMGVGDVVIPKRMNKIAEAFMGRVKAYTEVLDREDLSDLSEVLERNMTGQSFVMEDGAPASALAEYVMALNRTFQNNTLDTLLTKPDFYHEK